MKANEKGKLLMPETLSGDDNLSAKQAANMIGTDARTLRKFLRATLGLVGQGQRWAIDPDDIDTLKEQFAAWKAEQSKPATPKPVTAEVDDDDVEVELEEIDELEFEDIE